MGAALRGSVLGRLAGWRFGLLGGLRGLLGGLRRLLVSSIGGSLGGAAGGFRFPRVVGHVPARSFELDGGRREQALQFAAALRTFGQRFVSKLLDLFDTLPTCCALVFVKWQTHLQWYILENYNRRQGSGQNALSPLISFIGRRCLKERLAEQVCILLCDSYGRCE
jgi:hypothetical protein